MKAVSDSMSALPPGEMFSWIIQRFIASNPSKVKFFNKIPDRSLVSFTAFSPPR